MNIKHSTAKRRLIKTYYELHKQQVLDRANKLSLIERYCSVCNSVYPSPSEYQHGQSRRHKDNRRRLSEEQQRQHTEVKVVEHIAVSCTGTLYTCLKHVFFSKYPRSNSG